MASQFEVGNRLRHLPQLTIGQSQPVLGLGGKGSIGRPFQRRLNSGLALLYTTSTQIGETRLIFLLRGRAPAAACQHRQSDYPQTSDH